MEILFTCFNLLCVSKYTYKKKTLEARHVVCLLGVLTQQNTGHLLLDHAQSICNYKSVSWDVH
jgi:hypothetical protein